MKNDKHRCEESFISKLLYTVIRGGVQMPTIEQHKTLSTYAYDLSIEPFSDMAQKDAEKLIRRVDRMGNNTIKPLLNKAHGEKVLLTVYYFINRIMDMDYLIIPEDSEFRLLIDWLLKELPLDEERVKKRMANANKLSEKWLNILQGEGYYV